MSGQFAYHLRPTRLVGTRLVPLSKLRSLAPALAAEAESKYEGRERVRSWRIPVLDAGWDDVIHLAAIAPTLLLQELTRLGIRTSRAVDTYQIPVERLDPDACVYYRANPDAPWQPMVEPFDVQRYRELKSVPDRTLDYYARCAREERHPLLFAGVPHILVAHDIEIADLEREEQAFSEIEDASERRELDADA